jgi:hypothetical protein
MIQDNRLEKKEKVIDYLSHFPYYKWAATSINRDEDTLLLWRKEDSDFSDRCEASRAECLKKFGKKATPDLILKTTDPKTFNIANKIEGELNGELNINLINYGDKPSVQLSTQSVSTTATSSVR